jgi:hypothetical protein
MTASAGTGPQKPVLTSKKVRDAIQEKKVRLTIYKDLR